MMEYVKFGLKVAVAILVINQIGPLRDIMRTRIAEITGLNISRVAVKATTSERLGFTGREEGIAATASATIRLPWSE